MSRTQYVDDLVVHRRAADLGEPLPTQCAHVVVRLHEALDVLGRMALRVDRMEKAPCVLGIVVYLQPTPGFVRMGSDLARVFAWARMLLNFS